MEKGKRLLCGAYTQYTPSGKDLFVKANRWYKEPLVGDVVYFYSASMKRVAHVGIVIELVKNGDIYTIRTVEGNTSSGNVFNRNGGEVAKKEYTFNKTEVGKGRINGFGRPAFGEDTCTVQEFLDVVKDEIGYIEKANNKDLEDKKANVGDKNYTKYGAWYGGNGLYWCQQFVSWCAYKACERATKSKGTWIKNGSNWKYKVRGSFIRGQWLEIESRWYVFDFAGSMIKGWFKDKDSWYYLNKDDGAMLSSQWLEDKGNSYYLTNSGSMAVSCYVKDKEKEIFYWLDKDGIYRKEWDTNEPDLSRYELA